MFSLKWSRKHAVAHEMNYSHLENTTETEDDEEELLRLSRKVHLVYAIIQIALIPAIICSNVLVIVVIVVVKHLRSGPNLLLLSLASADLMVGIVACPLYSIRYLGGVSAVKYNRTACLAFIATVTWCLGASILSVLVIVIDRYVAVAYPIIYFRNVKSLRMMKVLISLWIYAGVLCSLPLMGWDNFTEGKCSFAVSLTLSYQYGVVYSNLGLFLMGSLIMYGQIVYMIRQYQRRVGHFLRNRQGASLFRFEREIRDTQLSAFIFSVFTSLWLPYFIVAFLRYTDIKAEVWTMVKNGTLVLGFGCSLANPILYVFSRSSYGVLMLLKTPFTRWRSPRSSGLKPISTSKMSVKSLRPKA